jgi:hypothetical protein
LSQSIGAVAWRQCFEALEPLAKFQDLAAGRENKIRLRAPGGLSTRFGFCLRNLKKTIFFKI